MHITLRQFEYFLALAETRQVSKAALRCHVSQSSVTVALRNMERTLGTPLFVRHAKGVRLTEAGERFVHHARNVTSAVTGAIQDIQATPSDIQGQLRVGVTETMSAYLMPQVLEKAEQRFPNLEIQVLENDRASIEHALMKGDIDLALLIVSNLTQADELEYSTLLKSQRRLWTHPDHPLQQLPQVSLHEIAQFDYVLLDMDEHIDTMAKYWRHHNLQARVHFQSRSLEAVRSLVAVQKGVTILSDLVYRPWSLEGRRILRRDVSDAIPTMDIGVVWRKDAAKDTSREVLVSFLRSTVSAITHE